MTQEIENEDNIFDELDAAERAYEAEDGNEDEQSTEQPKQSGAAYASDDVSGMTPAVAEGKMKELIATPGYATRQLKFDNPAAYSRILREVAALAQIAARGDAEKAARDFDNTVAMLKRQNKGKDALRGEAQNEMDKLVELGFDRNKLPDDVQAYQARALKEQRLLAEKNYAEIVPMLSEDLRALKAPADVAEAFRIFTSARDVDAGVREQIMDTALRYIYRANEQKRSRK